MSFDDLARDAAKAVHEQVDGHPLPSPPRRESPTRRLALALGSAVIVTAAVLGVTSLLGGEGTENLDQPSSTVPAVDTTTTTTTHTAATSPMDEGGRWIGVPHDPEVFSPATMAAITSHNGTLVAVGYEGPSLPRPVAWQSADGITWQRIGIESGNAVFSDVVSANGLLVAVGWNEARGAIWTSSDGVTWLPVVSPEGVFDGAANTKIEAVTPFQGGFVAVGYETLIELSDSLEGGYEHDDFARAAVWHSPDGLTWKRIEDPTFSGSGLTEMHAVATNGTSLVAVGRTSLSEMRVVPKAWYSENGLSWQVAPIDDDSETSFMTTVTSDGRFYWAAGRDFSTEKGVRWGGDGAGWEREGAIASQPSNLEPSAYIINQRGRFIVGRFSGAAWFIEPAENYPFFPALWTEFEPDPPFGEASFGDALWVEDRLVIVGSYRSPADQSTRSAVWQWVPPEPLIPPSVEVPDPNGPLCSAVTRIAPDSQLWNQVARALFAQEKNPRGLTDDNAPVYVEAVMHDGWVALITWFDGTTEGQTLWVGEPAESGWTFTPVWSRFGGAAEEILRYLRAAFVNAPDGLLCVDTEAFRTQ